MPSIFAGKNGLRVRYNEMAFAAINLTSAASDSKMLCSFKSSGRIVLFDNATDVDLQVWVIHPEVTDETAKLFLLELPAGRPLNFDLTLMGGFEFDAGTRVFICRSNSAIAATTGKLRVVSWG